MKWFFILALFFFGQILNAQKNMFTDSLETVKCYYSSKYIFYTPRFFSNYSKNPTNGRDSILFITKKDAAARAQTTNGITWILIKKGTKMRGTVSNENKMIPYAIDTCGNYVDGLSFFYLEQDTTTKKGKSTASTSPDSLIKFVPLSEVGKLVGPKGEKGDKRDIGPKGDKGEIVFIESTFFIFKSPYKEIGIAMACLYVGYKGYTWLNRKNTPTTAPVGVGPGGNTGPSF